MFVVLLGESTKKNLKRKLCGASSLIIMCCSMHSVCKRWWQTQELVSYLSADCLDCITFLQTVTNSIHSAWPDVTKVYFHATALLAHIHCLVVLVRGHGLDTGILQSWSWSWFWSIGLSCFRDWSIIYIYQQYNTELWLLVQPYACV